MSSKYKRGRTKLALHSVHVGHERVTQVHQTIMSHNVRFVAHSWHTFLGIWTLEMFKLQPGAVEVIYKASCSIRLDCQVSIVTLHFAMLRNGNVPGNQFVVLRIPTIIFSCPGNFRATLMQ